MFGKILSDETEKYFESLKRDRQNYNKSNYDTETPVTNSNDDIRVPFLNFAISTPQRHQTMIPAVGALHNCCESSPIFSSISRQLLFTGFTKKQPTNQDTYLNISPDVYLSTNITKTIKEIIFLKYNNEITTSQKNSYYSVMNTFETLRSSDAFNQLISFIKNFNNLVQTSFKDIHIDDTNQRPVKRSKVEVACYGKTHGTLELFQKMILMHATYFLAFIILGDHSDRITTFLKMVFNTPTFSESIIKHFRQRATVFLVPRRHGKTWFLVPLIALVMATFKGIKVGYTAHIRKATEPVFEEIGARLRQWFGTSRVEHVKGENISFSFDDGSKSTIVFASSHNTNVSMNMFYSHKKFSGIFKYSDGSCVHILLRCGHPQIIPFAILSSNITRFHPAPLTGICLSFLPIPVNISPRFSVIFGFRFVPNNLTRVIVSINKTLNILLSPSTFMSLCRALRHKHGAKHKQDFGCRFILTKEFKASTCSTFKHVSQPSL